MKKTFVTALFAVLLTMPALQSCTDDDNGPNTVYYTNIVTFDKNEGPYMIYSYQKQNDSPLIELQARGNVDTKVLAEGSRTLITYSYADKDNVGGSGMINLLNIQHIYTDTVSVVPAVPVDFSETYKTVALQRSGIWLNLYCEVEYVEPFRARKFTIVADESTLDDEIPQLYLGTTVSDAGVKSVDSRTYVSVNINKVWSLPTCKGVDVHVYNRDPAADDTYRFLKSDE